MEHYLARRNLYLAILTVGIVFALLTVITDQPTETALTILYITITVVLIIKLLDEWRYFQNYNAPIASGIFIGIPSLIGYGGTLLAHIVSLGENDILQSSLFDISLNIGFIGNYVIFLNIFGVIFALPPLIFLLFLLQKYYSNRYPSIFIFRKKFPNEVVVLYNLSSMLVLVLFWVETGFIEFSGLCFVLASIILLVQNYVLKVVLIPIRRVPVGRSNQQSFTRSTTRSSQTSPNLQRRPRTTQTRPTLVSQTRISSQAQRNSSVTVVPGLQTARTVTRLEKINPAILTKLVPSGQHLSDDDFRCIFCYQFPTEPNKRVVVCPHCGHPAHSNELEKWLSVADICSRCNKPISTKRMYRLSGKNYEKLIKMYKENQINNRWG